MNQQKVAFKIFFFLRVFWDLKFASHKRRISYDRDLRKHSLPVKLEPRFPTFSTLSWIEFCNFAYFDWDTFYATTISPTENISGWENGKVRPKKKNCLFPSERPGEIFFPTMWPVNFFRNNKWIKKILNRKRNLKKRKKNEISWKRKMLGHSSSLTFFIYIYKSQIHMFQLV